MTPVTLPGTAPAKARTALLIATVAIIGYSVGHFVAFPGYAANRDAMPYETLRA